MWSANVNDDILFMSVIHTNIKLHTQRTLHADGELFAEQSPQEQQTALFIKEITTCILIQHLSQNKLK